MRVRFAFRLRRCSPTLAPPRKAKQQQSTALLLRCPCARLESRRSGAIGFIHRRAHQAIGNPQRHARTFNKQQHPRPTAYPHPRRAPPLAPPPPLRLRTTQDRTRDGNRLRRRKRTHRSIINPTPLDVDVDVDVDPRNINITFVSTCTCTRQGQPTRRVAAVDAKECRGRDPKEPRVERRRTGRDGGCNPPALRLELQTQRRRRF